MYMLYCTTAKFLGVLLLIRSTPFLLRQLKGASKVLNW
jgi:hypothetical protein